MGSKWKRAPTAGKYVVVIYAIGATDLIFEDEKSLQETDIVLSVSEVLEGGEWPIKVEHRTNDKDTEIKHSEWLPNETEINGSHTIKTGQDKISFPYSFVVDDHRIDRKYQSQIIVERLRIGDDVYFVKNYELRRCKHQNKMKIKSGRQKSGSLFNLVEGELGEGESLICTECNSIIQ